LHKKPLTRGWPETIASPNDRTTDFTPEKSVWENLARLRLLEIHSLAIGKIAIELASGYRNFRPTQLLDWEAPNPSTGAQI